jgi:hypothetical protein
MPSSTIVIDRRYRGPLASANGGYAAGLLARAIDGPAEVTLRLPPPLERPLELRVDGERAVLLDGESLVAEARSADPCLAPPASPTWGDAVIATASARSFDSPEFAECFVCGTRPDGDGLGIHVGPLAGRVGIVAAPWVAHGVSPEVVWASIDCPGGHALQAETSGEPVLARIAARVDRLPGEGEPCVVLGWSLGREGRKLNAGTALVGEDGLAIAVSRQLWIEPRSRTGAA